MIDPRAFDWNNGCITGVGLTSSQGKIIARVKNSSDFKSLVRIGKSHGADQTSLSKQILLNWGLYNYDQAYDLLQYLSSNDIPWISSTDAYKSLTMMKDITKFMTKCMVLLICIRNNCPKDVRNIITQFIDT